MGRIRTIFELVNGKLPSYNSAFLKARGVAHPIDTFLTGTLRFSRKVGSPLPIWLPDNQMSLSQGAHRSDTLLKVSDSSSWVRIGSKLRLDGRLTVLVEDILDDGFTLSLRDPIILPYDAGTTVDLYGHPLEVNGTYTPSPTTSPTMVRDTFVRNLTPLQSVAACSDANTTLFGEPTIDGVSLASGARVLLTGQVDPIENGIWVVSVSSWSRPSDFPYGGSAYRGHVYVLGGETYTGTSWVCTVSAESFTVGVDPLTWGQISTVTTFVVHSDVPIYVGDVINYGSFEYDVVGAVQTGTHSDGRRTYQLVVDVGIPDTLHDGAIDQVYLRCYPSYESTPRTLPLIPVTSNNVGPFLYDRVSGSFFEDLYVEEVDILTSYSASGDVIFIDNNAGKNRLVYNLAIPSDSFLFWDLSLGSLNYSKSSHTFVAYTNHDGKFHLHFDCVPEIVHEKGFEGWRVQVTPQVDCKMIVHLEPNDPLPPVTLSAGGTTAVDIPFLDGSKDIKRIHVLFDTGSDANARIDMEGWEIQGLQTVAYVSHTTIAKVVGGNVWASGSAFAKPYWLRLTYLMAQADLYARFNGGLLAT